MIPRNIFHKTTLQKISQKSKDPFDRYEFEDNKLSIKKHTGNDNHTIFRFIRKDIQKYQWKGITSFQASFLAYHKKDANKFGDYVAKNFVSIKTLDLKFMTSDTIQGSELEGWAHKISRNCRKLQHVSLKIRINNNKHEAVQIFAKEIGLWLPKIRSLSFNFKKSDLRTQGDGDEINRFSKLLSRCQNLQKLSIALNESKIQDRSLQGMAYWVCTKLVGLQKLSLEIEETEVTDRGLEELTEKIGKNLHMLNHLCLLSDETKVTEDGVKVALQNLLWINGNLNFLHLRFPQPKPPQREKYLKEIKSLSPNTQIICRFGYLALIRNPHGLSLARS